MVVQQCFNYEPFAITMCSDFRPRETLFTGMKLCLCGGDKVKYQKVRLRCISDQCLTRHCVHLQGSSESWVSVIKAAGGAIVRDITDADVVVGLPDASKSQVCQSVFSF